MTSLFLLPLMILMPEAGVSLSYKAMLELPSDVLLANPEDVIAKMTEILDSKTLQGDALSKAYLRRGQAYMAKREFDKAKSDFHLAINVSPADLDSRYWKANALAALNKYDEAQKEFENLIRDRLDYAPAFVGMASIMFQRKEPKSGFEFASKAIRIIERSNVSGRWLSDHSFAYFLKAMCLYEEKKWDEGLQALNRCIEIQPVYGSSTAERPYLLRGMILTELSRYKEALENLDMARMLKPGSYEVWLQSYTAFRKWDKHFTCCDVAERLVQLNPKDTQSWLAAALSYNATGQYEKAVKAAKEGLKLDAKSEDLHIQLGKAYEGQGACQQASTEYDSALSLDPDYVFALAAKSLLLSTSPDNKVRDEKAAKQIADKACQVCENKEFCALIALAAAYGNSQDYDLAVTKLRHILKFPNLPALERQQSQAMLSCFEAKKPYRQR